MSLSTLFYRTSRFETSYATHYCLSRMEDELGRYDLRCLPDAEPNPFAPEGKGFTLVQEADPKKVRFYGVITDNGDSRAIKLGTPLPIYFFLLVVLGISLLVARQPIPAFLALVAVQAFFLFQKPNQIVEQVRGVLKPAHSHGDEEKVSSINGSPI